MEKCTYNPETLKKIRSKVKTLATLSKLKKWPLDTIIKNFTKLLDEDIPNNIDLEFSNIISDEIYDALPLSVIDLSSEFFNTKNILDMLTGVKQGLIKSDNLETSAKVASFQEKEQILLRRNATSEFLDKAYGMVSDARKLALDMAKLNIFDVLFINRGSIKEGLKLGIVQSNIDLNRNIRNYQEYLFRLIVSYLNSISEDLLLNEDLKAILSNPIFYNDNFNSLTVLEPLIALYLSRDTFKSASDPTDLALDGLRSLYNLANTSNEPRLKLARLRLDAYNANVILQNFDSFLNTVLGDIIEILDFGVRTGKDNKYSIGQKTAKLLTTWSNSEDRDVESEADFITKLAINTTPLYNWQGNTPRIGEYLTFADYQYIIGKIKDLAWNEKAVNTTVVSKDRYRIKHLSYWDELSEETKEELDRLANSIDRPIKVSTIINIIRRNPRKYVGIIFDLLSNLKFQNILNTPTFSENDLNVIYSLNKGIFSSNYKDGNSLYNLTNKLSDIDYYSFITLTADTIFNVDYVQYYRDEDGKLLVRTFISLNLNNIRRNIETTINASNNIRTIRDFEDYEKSLDLNEDSLTLISFTIPNTKIRITVDTVGNIRFKNDNLNIILFEQFFSNVDILNFLDSKLRLGLRDNIKLLEALRTVFTGGKNAAMEQLLSFASRIVLNQHIINKYIEPVEGVEAKEKKISEIFGKKAIKYNRQLDIVEVLSSYDIPNLRKIAIAKANTLGVTTATQTKDGSGNNLSLQTLSRLLGSHWSQFELQEKNANSATRDSLILTVPGLYEGVYTSKEYYDIIEGTKSFVDMSVSEFTQASFLYDFIGGIIPKLNEDGSKDTNAIVGNSHVMFLPSVNSDKNTIGRIKIDLNKLIVAPDGKYKSISEFNHAELRWLIAKTFGNIYTNIYKAVLLDFNTLRDYINKAFEDFPGFDYLNNFKLFNTWWYNNQERLAEYGKTPSAFVKAMTLAYNKTHRLKPLTLVDLTYFKSLDLELNIDDNLVTIKKALVHNLVLISQIARYNPTYLTEQGIDISAYPDSKTFWRTKHREVLDSLLKSKFEINTTNKDLSEIKYLRTTYPQWVNESGNVILAKLNFNGLEYNVTSNRDLIKFKYLIKDNLITDNNINNTDLLEHLANIGYTITLHPEIERWNYLDYLFTLEFMDCTVGSFINHPEKSKGLSEDEIRLQASLNGVDPNPLLHKRVLLREAAHFLALHKRNVSFTAAMHEFQLNLLNGIPEEYNLAVVEDIKDYQGTITGFINEIKPFDGATVVNPFVVILENNSLGGARAGITKKLFVHFKDERIVGGGIIKTAGFGLTNDWIRNSPFLLKMMQKMTNHVWLTENGIPAEVDITRDYENNPITTSNKYFSHNGKIYQITSIKYLGNNQYRRVLRQIKLDENNRPMINLYVSGELIMDADGNLRSNNEVDDNWVREHTEVINTNYKLWQFFGGTHSMSEDGRYLKYSNSSVENVVTIMNRTACLDANGNPILKNTKSVKTLDDIWLPLKQVDVHYLATAGAVKQGAANINSADKYFNNEAYDTLRIKMYLAGILLDKEHHADNAELSLMTLVISACAAKGYTFEAASRLYDALRKASEISTDEHLKGIKQYITSDDKTGVLEAMYKAIINSLGTSKQNSTNFAYLIASDIIKLARAGKKIQFSEVALPLSDKTIYSKMISIISSYLTNTGIKLSIPGILSVLTPSYNIFKLYAGRKYESFTNPEVELTAILLELDKAPIFDANNPATSISNIKLGRTYRIRAVKLKEVINPETGQVSELPNGEYEDKYILINTPIDYQNLKNRISNHEIVTVTEAVTDDKGNPIGRDLASYNVYFLTIDGQFFLLGDLDSELTLFAIHSYNKLPEPDRTFNLTNIRDIYFPNASINDLDKLARRWLLKDLMNLSNTTKDIISQYELLLGTNDYSQEWFDRYAQWVNIYLGTGEGSTINGQSVVYENFEEVEKLVRKLIEDSTKVRIDGNLYTVNKLTIKVDAYEIIMPKTFKTNFGLNEFTDLNEVENDKNWFVKQYKRNSLVKVNDSNYTIALKTSTGNHTYLISKNLLSTANLTKVDRDNIGIMPVDDKLVRVDSEGNIMYEISDDFELYIDNITGNEVIATDNLTYYINNTSFESIQLSSILLQRTRIFETVLLQIKEAKNAKFFYRYLGFSIKRRNFDEAYRNSVLYNDVDSNTRLIRALHEKHTSFLKALDVVAARIPSQSMQSFMPMKVVAFDNPDINTAFVSTMQILLQGSDYRLYTVVK